MESARDKLWEEQAHFSKNSFVSILFIFVTNSFLRAKCYYYDDFGIINRYLDSN